MLLKLLLDMVSMTMLLFLVWFLIGSFTLHKKSKVIGQVYLLLNSMFEPVLLRIRSFLPKATNDYSPVVMIVTLWFLQKFLQICN